jgi:hypothetical protein
MGANSGLPSTGLVLSMFYFVWSLCGDGTGHAVTWLKKVGSCEKRMRGNEVGRQ